MYLLSRKSLKTNLLLGLVVIGFGCAQAYAYSPCNNNHPTGHQTGAGWGYKCTDYTHTNPVEIKDSKKFIASKDQKDGQNVCCHKDDGCNTKAKSKCYTL